MSDRVPVRHSLITRLLATSVLIAVAAITSTAWLAASTATRAVSQEQGRVLDDDKGVYDMLIAYAATHPDWSGAPALIDARAAELGRRITLMTEERSVIAESGTGPSLRTARPSAVVDPLNLDLGLTGGTDSIDARAVGPYLVPPAERPALRDTADQELTCLRKVGFDATIRQEPSGRPQVILTSPDRGGVANICRQQLAALVSKTEQKALRTLSTLTATCLNLGGRADQLQIRPDFTAYLSPTPVTTVPGSSTVLKLSGEELVAVMATDQATRGCVEKERRTQLQAYVAPRVLLFVTDARTGVDRTTFTLSTGNTVRIITVTGAILLITIAVTVLAGRRLVRPLRVLTESAARHIPAVVSTKDEIGHLARALNDSAGHRERADAQRRAMVNDVAHELRSPLSNIRIWLEAAQDDLTPTDAQLLALLHEEVILLQHIIDDLRDLAAADAGTLRIHPEPTYVRDVLTQVVDSHRGAAHAAGVDLQLDIPHDPVLPADQVRLRQLVGNLVSNAIRYTPAGGTVTVAAHDTTITVQDTGTGIPAEYLPKIFDRFWRADQSRSRSTGGSGLGLAIARHLAEVHGGTIEVASQPGQGTLFTIRLPTLTR
ncbi:MAG: two-component system, OmpR family, sensor histidine kinase BaeS [Actinoplanes sp.]|nr:two-component system, OmpR family, sensor histidine kinase BaeS [Actinoplanes sp.]